MSDCSSLAERLREAKRERDANRARDERVGKQRRVSLVNEDDWSGAASMFGELTTGKCKSDAIRNEY
jgi:hypothetical protein